MTTLTLRVPPELERALERHSEALGVSKSDLAREALRRFLRVAEFRALREELVPLAQDRGLHTDDDVFEALARR